MKNIFLLLLALVLSVGVMSGCGEKKKPAGKVEEKAVEMKEETAKAVGEMKEEATEAASEVKEEAAEAVEAGKELTTEVKEKAAEEVGAAKETAAEAAGEMKEEASAMVADTEAIVKGAALFKTKCAACHGADGVGTAMAPAFKPNDWVRDSSDSDIADTITKGREGAAKRYKKFVIGMPAQKGLSEAEVDSLVAYLKDLASGKTD